jgi:SAM-dependent methyltransferase
MSNDGNIQQYLEQGYALGRGYSSSLRLNFQHHLLHELLGYSIHPDILAKGNLPSNPRIADVGAGTGQWLIDVSKEIPSAQLDGIDISRDQYPNKAWLPSQISLHKLDIRRQSHRPWRENTMWSMCKYSSAWYKTMGQ